MAKFDPWPIFFRREWKRNWPFLVGFAVTGTIITKFSLGLTEEDAKNSPFVQRHKRLKARLNASISSDLKQPQRGLDKAATTETAEFLKTAPTPIIPFDLSMAAFVLILRLPKSGTNHLGLEVKSVKVLGCKTTLFVVGQTGEFLHGLLEIQGEMNFK
uniref:Uncharacterized protein n=2 Tax=Cannabis sativa TaxID=3483 RepID=A0A803Q0I6_CANSA